MYRRFGENDASLSVEDKMLERFMKEKVGRLEKKAVFNLDQEELELTHMGQSLSNMDAFETAGLHRMESDSEGNRELTNIFKFLF